MGLLNGRVGRVWMVFATGMLCLCLSAVGLVISYYYSWRITTPGLPAAVVPKYEYLSKSVGLGSLGMLALSIGVIAYGFVQVFRNKRINGNL